MMKLLRRHKDWLMIVIAILAIPFIFYFVRTPDYGSMRSDVVGPIYGRKIPVAEIQGYMRLGVLAQALGASDLWQLLSVNQPENRGYEMFALNLLVLRHEAAGSVSGRVTAKSRRLYGHCRRSKATQGST